jgi:hypothetical protein
MAIKTTQEQLEEVQAAITKVMRGQSTTIDGEIITRADLSALQDREDRLLLRHRQETGQIATRVYARNGGRT